MLMLVSVMMLAACNQKEEFDTTPIREDLLELIKEFGPTNYEDTDWEAKGANTIYKGSAHIVIGERDDSINLLIVEKDKVAMLEIALEPAKDKTKTYPWNVMINYTDNDKRIYIRLDFYHPGGSLFRPSFGTPEIIHMNYYDYANDISKLKMEDIEWILIELGYAEINWEG